jgi:hypothetical protein
VRCPGDCQHAPVGTLDRREAAHGQRLEPVRTECQLQAAEREPRVAVVGKVFSADGIGNGQEIRGDVIRC